MLLNASLNCSGLKELISLESVLEGHGLLLLADVEFDSLFRWFAETVLYPV
jgi:hypothetical protein